MLRPDGREERRLALISSGWFLTVLIMARKLKVETQTKQIEYGKGECPQFNNQVRFAMFA